MKRGELVSILRILQTMDIETRKAVDEIRTETLFCPNCKTKEALLCPKHEEKVKELAKKQMVKWNRRETEKKNSYVS